MPQALLERVRQARKLADERMGGVIGRSTVVEVLDEVEAYLTAQEQHSDPMVRAIKSLSYSELEGIQAIARHLESDEGLLVSSHIADQCGFAWSVIVSALRKLESAGVIEARSLGMKGTHIKPLVTGWRQRVLQVA